MVPHTFCSIKSFSYHSDNQVYNANQLGTKVVFTKRDSGHTLREGSQILAQGRQSKFMHM